MDTGKVKEIIDRKSSIPLENESFEVISKAYDMASEIIDKAIPKLIKARECWKCELENCEPSCDKNFNRCPKCNVVLDNDCGENINIVQIVDRHLFGNITG